MRTKRLLSLVMALCMLFTLTAPTFAWAVEDGGSDGTEAVETANVKTYRVTIRVSPSRAKAKVKVYAQREEEYGPELMRELERVILLRVVDEYWMDHIDAMA